MTERFILGVLIVMSIVLTLWFILGLGKPWRATYPAGAWLWAAISWVTIALDALLVMVLARVAFPSWVAAIVLLAQDGVWIWRLQQLYQARRIDRKDHHGH